MKSRKSIYVLLPIVILIWGLVIYKFFSFSGTEEVMTPGSIDFSLKPLVIKPKDSIKIDVNYRDPFLGEMYISTQPKHEVTAIRNLPHEEPIVWPNVIYRGIVSDTKDKNKVFMVIINGKAFLMKEKDTEQDITLKRGNGESIFVNYKGDETQILLQE